MMSQPIPISDVNPIDESMSSYYVLYQMELQSGCCTSQARDEVEIEIICISENAESIKEFLNNYLKSFKSIDRVYIIECLFEHSIWDANRGDCESGCGYWLKLQKVNIKSKQWNSEYGKKVSMNPRYKHKTFDEKFYHNDDKSEEYYVETNKLTYKQIIPRCRMVDDVDDVDNTDEGTIGKIYQQILEGLQKVEQTYINFRTFNCTQEVAYSLRLFKHSKFTGKRELLELIGEELTGYSIHKKIRNNNIMKDFWMNYKKSKKAIPFLQDREDTLVLIITLIYLYGKDSKIKTDISISNCQEIIDKFSKSSDVNVS